MIKYGALQSKLKTGDLLAFRATGPISRFIRSWTSGSYSHVGIAWVYKGNYFILQDKEFHGVDLEVLSNLLPCDWIQTNADWSETVDSYALAHLGQNYSYINAVRAGLGMKPIGVNRICSEFALTVLQMAKVLPMDCSALTPVQLVNALLDADKPLQVITKG